MSGGVASYFPAQGGGRPPTCASQRAGETVITQGCLLSFLQHLMDNSKHMYVRLLHQYKVLVGRHGGTPRKTTASHSTLFIHISPQIYKYMLHTDFACDLPYTDCIEARSAFHSITWKVHRQHSNTYISAPFNPH